MPRLTWLRSRPPSTAKLDHSACTLPLRPTITPSKSAGPFTSVATSRFASRNCSVRDNGKLTSSTEATVVAIERTLESLARPITVTGSPATSSRESSCAERIGVPSSSAGSNETMREVVQRMHVLDPAGNLDRAAERQPHVAHRHGHRVAIHRDEAARRVDDQARAVVVALGDARHREGHEEIDHHQRRRDAIRELARRWPRTKCAPGVAATAGGAGGSSLHGQ